MRWTDWGRRTARIALLALVLDAQAQWGPYSADLERVIDGDSAVLMLMIYPGLRQRARVRLADVDTPELHGQCKAEKILARSARDRMRELLTGAELEVEVWGVDKYGRPLVTITADGASVSDVLVGEGLARPYDGGTRQPWC